MKKNKKRSYKETAFLCILNIRRQKTLNRLLRKRKENPGVQSKKRKRIEEKIMLYNTRISPLLAPVQYKRRRA